jgi:hypothetical protein
VTLREFMNYLKYIEYSAENLQFFLWYRDYASRWEKLKDTEKALAPEWTVSAEADATVSTSIPKRMAPHVAEMLRDTDFDDRANKAHIDRGYPFPTSNSPSFDEHDISSDRGSIVSDERTLFSSTVSTNHAIATEQAFEDAGVKWQPCMFSRLDSLTSCPFDPHANPRLVTAQPYRDEVSRIVSIYIAENSPRELNLSSREKQAVLHALQHTTHPSAFKSIVTSVEWSLRRQAHPNYIRWTICNGNRPRVIFARGLGIFTILAGFLADLLITLSSVGRAWRVVPLIGFFIGVATLIAAWKGMCVVLHGLHHRHLRPWELFLDDSEETMTEKSASLDSVGSARCNSFEEEPWVPRYGKRNIIRKVFDREVWIQEPALRQIQDTIFLQAVLGAFLVSAICVGIFCAVPHGNFY